MIQESSYISNAWARFSFTEHSRRWRSYCFCPSQMRPWYSKAIHSVFGSSDLANWCFIVRNTIPSGVAQDKWHLPSKVLLFLWLSLSSPDQASLILSPPFQEPLLTEKPGFGSEADFLQVHYLDLIHYYWFKISLFCGLSGLYQKLPSQTHRWNASCGSNSQPLSNL